MQYSCAVGKVLKKFSLLMGFELNFNLFTTEMLITTCVNPHPFVLLVLSSVQITVVNFWCLTCAGVAGRSLKPNPNEHDSVKKAREKCRINNQEQGCKVDLEMSVKSLPQSTCSSFKITSSSLVFSWKLFQPK